MSGHLVTMGESQLPRNKEEHVHWQEGVESRFGDELVQCSFPQASKGFLTD